MKLSILIPALSTRPWKNIVDKLETQIANFNLNGHVEILIKLDAGESTSGTKRQELLNVASGDYICYVDDDDDVHDDYIEDIFEGCHKDVDIISFNVDFIRDNFYKEIWNLGCYPNNRRNGVMLVNHLCAWRRSIAKRVSWSPFLGNSDDHVWSQPLFFAGFIKTQYHINKGLYRYMYDSSATVNQSALRRKEALNYFQKGVRCFWYNSEVVIEHDPRLSEVRNITCRFADSSVKKIPIQELTQFYTVLP